MSFKLARFFIMAVGFLLASYGAWATSSVPNSQFTHRIKFEDLADIVKANNENVEASRLHTEAQEKRTGRTARSFLPQFSASTGQEQFKKDSQLDLKSASHWKVEANLNLFKGGRDYLEGKIRNTAHDLSKVDHQIAFKHELKKAKQTYWKIVSINLLLEDTLKALEKNDENSKTAKRRVGAGIATAADAVQFELHKISLNRELTKLELEKDVALNQLSVNLALNDHKNIEVEKEYPKIQYQHDETKSNPTYLRIKKQYNLEQIEELKSNQSARWWWPKLDAYANYHLPALSEDFADATAKDKQWTAGIKLTVDLGQGYEDQIEALAKKYEAKALQNRAAYAQREEKALDHELRHDMQILAEQIKNSEHDINLAHKYLKLTEDEYNRGAKNGPDLLSATQTYFEFREKRHEYYLDYLSTQAELESLME